MLDQLIAIAENLKATTFDIKWDHHLCFSIGGKLYCVTSPDEVPVTVCIKVDEEKFEEYVAIQGIKQAPYFAKGKWILIENIDIFSKTEWNELLSNAYQMVAAKLTKKMKLELGIK